MKRKTGTFFKVPIDDVYHTYGRILDRTYAFYDFKTDLDNVEINEIEKAKILFNVFVHRSAINKGGWEIVGYKELSSDLKEPVPFFIQTKGKPEVCYIDINDDRKKVSPAECIGIERYAVWEHNHVQERLSDHYKGIPNKNTEISKVKILPQA
jgi:hypothetical protein